MSFRGEYICISCWTSFEGAPNGQGLVTCPHCDFVQPISDDPDATVQTSVPEHAVRATPVAAKPPTSVPPTTAKAAPPPTAKAAPPRPPEPKAPPAKGLEPLSLDSLESFSQEESIPPPVPPPAKAKAVPPPSRSASLPPSAPEDSEPPPPEPDTSLGDTTVWRVKSDSGLTYCFFSAEKLIRWVEGLGPQKNAMVSVDGINWKAYADFKQKYAGESEAMAAFEASAEGKPAASVSPGPTASVATSLPPKREQKGPARTVTSMQAVQARGAAQTARTGARSKPQTTGEQRRAAQITAERPAPADAPATGRRAAAGASGAGWGARLGFMAAGMVLGGAGVYFGMYLLGFYDLAMPF